MNDAKTPNSTLGKSRCFFVGRDLRKVPALKMATLTEAAVQLEDVWVLWGKIDVIWFPNAWTWTSAVVTRGRSSVGEVRVVKYYNLTRLKVNINELNELKNGIPS